MNMKKVLVVAMLLLIGSFTLDAVAQEAIKALVKKCENMESVNISTVRDRNKETKKVSRSVISISINKSDTALINEFIAAFEKDKIYADKEIENKTKGEVSSLFYQFGNTSYSLSLSKSGSASVSIIQKGED